MRKRIRGKVHTICGCSVQPANPGMLGECWTVVPPAGRSRYYESFAAARQAAKRVGDGLELSGGWGIIG